MTPDDLERLTQFIAGYFNQDWDLDAPDSDGTVDLYLADGASDEDRLRLAGLLDSFATVILTT